jgi:hypothetical protein
MPPFIVYPGKRHGTTNLLAGGIGTEGATLTESGWMTSDAFLTWLSQHFIPNLPPSRPQVLIIDSAGPHIDIRTFRHAKDNGIEIYRLPRNSTHLLQPLDNGVFGTVKSEWYASVRDFVRRFPSKKVTKETFCSVFRPAWTKGISQVGVIASFRKTGMFPVDRSVIQQFNLKPSLTLAIVKDPSPATEHPQATGPTALAVFESCLQSPVVRTYNSRLEESYDLVGSPSYQTWLKLRQMEAVVTPPPEDPIPCVEEACTMPPLLESVLKFPSATAPKQQTMKRKLSQELPDYLTGEVSLQMCEEQQIKKMKVFMLQQRRLRLKEESARAPKAPTKKAAGKKPKSSPLPSVESLESSTETDSTSSSSPSSGPTQVMCAPVRPNSPSPTLTPAVTAPKATKKKSAGKKPKPSPLPSVESLQSSTETASISSSSPSSGPTQVMCAPVRPKLTQTDPDACRYCGGVEINDLPDTPWVLCPKCKCWMHVDCLPPHCNRLCLDMQDDFECC